MVVPDVLQNDQYQRNIASVTWYDNEMGYTHTLVEHVIKAGRLI